MFSVDQDGNLVYDPGDVPDDEPVSDDLFAVPEVEEDALETQAPDGPDEPLPSDQEPVPDDIDISPSPAPEPIVVPISGLEVSGDELSLTTSGDVYVYPDSPDPLLDMERSPASATVQGLPNSTSLQYLEDVASGYPSWYKYVAFKSDANYSQSMVLYIGSAGNKNPAQNRLDFTDVDRIEINYVRSGSTYYYEYASSHYDSYQVPYNDDVFLYTNVVDGYAQFGLQRPFPTSSILFLAVAVAILSLIFRGGGKT